jgi:anti-sigma regulatory factor (Ser/Thr protein kinase)
VSGDLSEFIDLPDGRIGVLVADVTDKGVPAAMVMATSRSILRAASERILEPGQVLARANELLHPDIPAKMFVTCLYLVFDPTSGRLTFANAGHNLPYLQTADGVVELRATGMPLGLMPGMDYEQKEVVINRGESLLLSSDGIVEAHNHAREMFSFPRLKELVGGFSGEGRLISYLMEDFNSFVGAGYEQEDDITLVMLKRSGPGEAAPPAGMEQLDTLGDFEIASEPGNEREAASRVLSAVETLGLSERRRKRLETAVAESTMNAMEHGNQYDPEKPVRIVVRTDGDSLRVSVHDHGTGNPIPASTSPDLEAKLDGDQSPRGWGLFLIKNMVDELNVDSGEDRHSIELVFHLESDSQEETTRRNDDGE